MKNILNFDEYGSISGVTLEKAASLTKQQSRIFLDNLLETFATLLDRFIELNRGDKQNDLACKRDIIKSHYLKLQSLYPMANTGWHKFSEKEGLMRIIFLGQGKYDMQDIYRLSRGIFERSFVLARDSNRDLYAEYSLYVLKKEPERWKEIYLLLQNRPEEDRFNLVDVFLRIESKDVQQEISQNESDFIRDHFCEFLEKSDHRQEGLFWIHGIPWLQDYLDWLFASEFRPIWDGCLDQSDIWSIVSVNKDTFDRYWADLDEKHKNLLIHSVDCSVTYDFFEVFSAAEKEALAEYYEIQYITVGGNRHLWWVSREKRLDFIKRHTPHNNALCYNLFEYSRGHSSHGLMSYIGTESELLNAEELAKYVEFLIDKYGRDGVYVSEAIDRYEKWLVYTQQSSNQTVG